MALLRWALLAGVVVYTAWLALLVFAQRSMTYPGARIPVGPEPPPAPGLERWRVATPSGAIDALFLPAAGADAAGRRPAVVFGHGNGEVADFWVSGLDGFRARGMGVLVVEYPGYGRSEGKTTEASIRVAFAAAYDRLVADPRVDGTRVLGFGQSLGGGAVCLLSRDRPLKALVLQSTFPSFAVFAARYGAPAFLLRDLFDNEAALRAYPGPVLVIHGSRDELIPPELGRRVAAASPRATFLLYDCAHGCWDPDRLPFWKDVDPFLARAGFVSSGR